MLQYPQLVDVQHSSSLASFATASPTNPLPVLTQKLLVKTNTLLYRRSAVSLSLLTQTQCRVGNNLEAISMTFVAHRKESS